MTIRNIYNVSASESFVDFLAAHFLRQYSSAPDKLSQILFLLPNRRSCQSMADAFVRRQGTKPTILPRMVPIEDVEEDEVFLSGNIAVLDKIEPAVNPTERLLLFTRLIMQKPELGIKRISLAQAYSLAQNLAQFMDTIYNENLSFDNLQNIVPVEYAAHWQQTLQLLQIITEAWPEILQERGKIDSIVRRHQLLEAEMQLWQQQNPAYKIVIAGSTAPFPLLKKLVQTVLNLSGGEVYLYGLDKNLEDFAWESIDENHPQYELKELLDFLHISRNEITDIPALTSWREKFVSEVMRPAASSSEWRKLNDNPLPMSAFENISMLNCDDIRQEAKSIALIIRRTLEEKEKTAALVTMDRNLSRRVISELQKWGITADDSSGKPLNLSALGIYLRLICDYFEEKSLTSLIALLKHPFTSCGFKRSDFNMQVRRLEKLWREEKPLTEDLQNLLDDFKQRVQPLADIYVRPLANIKDVFATHIQVAERLADTDIKSGDKIIWRGDDGRVAGNFISDFLAECDNLGEIAMLDYSQFFNILLSQQNVRIRYGMHPRVKILGPIEARLTQYDVTIIGEVNEGIWPKAPNADMWLSRPMKKDFGLPQPERSVGLSAADFSHLLHAPKVYMTRSQKLDGAPTNKSRWWLRMETVLEANFSSGADKYAFIYTQPYTYWAKTLDYTGNYTPIEAPNPRPEVSRRPRRLSASNVEKLMRDPYTIYAKYILNLKPLKDLDCEKQASDYGSVVHKVLQRFNDRYNQQFPLTAKQELLSLGEEEFANSGISEELMTFWWPKFMKSVDWLVANEAGYRPDISVVHNETKGFVKFSAAAGDFEVEAIADRIDETKSGELNILDYKTGRARSIKEMENSYAPQLPIEGLIAQKGGFAGLNSKKVNSLQYWTFKNQKIATKQEQSETAIDNIEKVLKSLINEFDNPSRPYIVNSAGKSGYSDYEHLSRFLEWSVKDSSTDNSSDNNGEEANGD